MIIFVFEVFALNISLGVGGYKKHELLRSGDTAGIIVIALFNFSDILSDTPHAVADDNRDAISL